MHAKTRLVPATRNDSICVQVHVAAFCARHRPLALHSGAEELLTTQGKMQPFSTVSLSCLPKDRAEHPGFAEGMHRALNL